MRKKKQRKKSTYRREEEEGGGGRRRKADRRRNHRGGVTQTAQSASAITRPDGRLVLEINAQSERCHFRPRPEVHNTPQADATYIALRK